MKLIFILTTLITGTAHAFTSHEDYALSVELMANKKLTHSQVKCSDADKDGFFSCVLKRTEVATDDGYEYDLRYMRSYLSKINETVWDDYKVPELYVKRE